DYNVLDYDEKVVDGFYDLYGLSMDHVNQGKLPSLADLQTSRGDPSFEVVIVNRAIDPALDELHQVAHCIAVDCPSSDVSLLVHRLAELVTEHFGGPVMDANIMLAKWMEKTLDLRSSLHTSILPIGSLNFGLSRHRALLFKVLADDVGVQCRLIKGSHYTGNEDDVINIVKLENEREFLVDLMAAPGTLIPVDVQDTSLNSLNPRLGKTPILQTESNTGVDLSTPDVVCNVGNGKPVDEYDISLKENSSSERIELAPSSSSASNGELPPSFWGISNENIACVAPDNQSHCSSSSLVGGSSQSTHIDNVVKENLNVVPYSLDLIQESENLFADLNPFGMVGSFESFMQGRPTDNRGNDSREKKEKLSSASGRSPLPMFMNNRSICNEFPRTKQSEFVEALLPRRNLGSNHYNASSMASPNSNSSSRTHPEVDNVIVNSSRASYLGSTSNSNGHHSDDRFVDTTVMSRHLDNSGSRIDAYPSRLDPMLEDVAEWEISWEDLVLGERIGIGSYGEVFHADWRGTEVAVKKFLDQDFLGDALDEFRSEVRIMRRLRHPNVILFLGAVTRPPNLSIITELLPRGSLYHIIHRPNIQIDERLRIKMALDVVKGMNCLHTSIPTVVHRDLKSPNLLVDSDWNVKVCDFGLSRLKHNTFLSSKSTAGTPEWMAPEVLRNEQSNEKCDVYSFGVILWELATLKLPWTGLNSMQVVGAVGFQNRRLEIPKEVDPLVARIIWECWQTDSNLRPSFAQLTTALEPLQRLVIPSNQDQK
ncbi:Serine/threonine-protein kinase EDR1, partial [Thalictrum thalictroides]